MTKPRIPYKFSRRLFSGLALLAVSLLLCGSSCGDAPLDGTRPAQWRVVWLNDPAHEALVAWSTAAAGDSHIVRYRKRGDDQWHETKCFRNGRYTGGQLYFHHARLTDLEPETAYDFKVVSNGNASPMFYFVTAPARDRPFTVIFGGDSRSGLSTRRAVNRMIADLVQSGQAADDPEREIIAFAHGGDYIVTGANLGLWSEWMSAHELTVADDGRITPIIPARGNHDGGSIFNQVFGFESDDSRNYYSVQLSPQMALVTLNTETSTSGDQATWLAGALAELRPKHRWLLAQYHRPAFPAVKSPSSALQSWVPLFERFNVDLVCEADGHVIKRTVPIHNGRQDPSGVVYIGEGGLGVPQRTPKIDRWFLQPPGMAASGHHVQLLTFTETSLEYRCVLLGGKVLDTYQRPPRK